MSMRRVTLGPRHALTDRESSDVTRPYSGGLDPEVSAALSRANTESELRAATAAVVIAARALLDHRRFVQDLDVVWHAAKAFRQSETQEIITMTTALRDALEQELQQIWLRPRQPWRRILALFDFVAELCWKNYVSVSHHAIRTAVCHLLSDDVNQSIGGDRCVEVCAYFLARVGEVLSSNSLEVWVTLRPLVARLTASAHTRPRRTQWFVWVLYQRMTHDWQGSVFLEVGESYWQDWSLARLVLLAGHKEDPVHSALAAIPTNASNLIAEFVCSRCPWDHAVVGWDLGDSMIDKETVHTRLSGWNHVLTDFPDYVTMLQRGYTLHHESRGEESDQSEDEDDSDSDASNAST